MSAKHCEWCGKESPNYFYRFIIEPDYIIFFNSPFVKSIDRVNQIVLLTSGEQVKYSVQVAPSMAVYYTEVLPHIFCSAKCEDDFIHRYGLPYRDDLPEKTAVISFKKNGYYAPMVIGVDKLSYNSTVCDHCHDEFPNKNKKYTSIKIIGRKIQDATSNTNPDLRNYPVAFSDMYEGKNHGKFYLFKIDVNQNNWITNQFCSNECAFDYSIKNEVIVIYKNNILEGKISAITPYTKNINEGLDNPYRYRPQKFNM
jgi:hypothetical protein